MNPEAWEKAKKKWIKALRSGKYKQARKKLLSPKTGGMCCLGVLCHISGVSREVLLDHNPDVDGDGLGAEFNYLSRPLRHELAQKNDGGSSFKTIANYIEKNL